MIKHFSKQIITTLVCCLTGFSIGYAQSLQYVGGNGATPGQNCTPNVTPYTPGKVQYQGGNGAAVAEYCLTGIFDDYEQIRAACNGGGGAQLSIKLLHGAGDYTFWWASCGKGSKDTPTSWEYEVENPGTGTFTLPGASFKKTDTRLYVYDGVQKDSIDITVTELQALNAGAINNISRTICVGGVDQEQLTELTAASYGAGTYTYYWVISGTASGTLTSGTSATSYTTAGTYVGGTYTDQAGVYTIQRFVDDGGCDIKASAGSYVLTVRNLPTVTLATSATTAICNGTDGGTLTATLTPADANGGVPSYTFSKSVDDGETWTSMASTTSTTYAVGNLTQTTDFKVDVVEGVNASCAATSSTVQVPVYAPFTPGTLTTASTTVCEGEPNTRIRPTSAAGGSGTFTYQWIQVKNSGTPSTVTSGTHTNEYTPGTLTGGTYVYTRWVTDNGCGATAAQTDGSYTIYVRPAFSAGTITSSSTPTICTGGTPDLIAGGPASGGSGSGYTYRWLEDGSTAPGVADGISYQPQRKSVSGAHTYTRIAYDPECNTSGVRSSGTYILTVSDPGAINIATPTQITVPYNGSATLTISSSTVTAPTYVWEMSADGGVSWSEVSTGSATTYAQTAMTATAYHFRVSGDNGGGCTFPSGNKAIVAVLPQFSAGTITSGSVTICANTSLSTILTSTAVPHGGSGDYDYRWTVKVNSNAAVDISSATASVYELSSGTYATQPGTYTFNRYVKDGDTGDELPSAGTYTLYVAGAPTIGTLATTLLRDICYGNDAGTLTVTATGAAGYNWQKSTGNTGVWEKIATATGSTYAPGTLTATTAFRVQALSSSGCASSFAEKTINVFEQFDPGTIESTELLVCEGMNTPTLINATSAKGGTGNYGYQWRYQNGATTMPVFGSGITCNPSMVGTPAINAQGTYTRAAWDQGRDFSQTSDACYSGSGTVYSAGSYIIRVVTPEEMAALSNVAITPATQEVVDGTTVTLKAVPNLMNGIYNWASSTDGTNFSNVPAGNGSYTLTHTPASLPTYYKTSVSVTGGDCTATINLNTSTAATVTMPAFSPGAITSATYTVCQGGTMNAVITGTIPTGGSGFKYQWFVKRGVENKPIPSATGVNFDPSTDYVFDSGVGDYHFTRVVTDGKGISLTSAGVFTVVVPPMNTVVITATTNDVLCGGANSGTLNVASPIAGASYTWEECIDTKHWLPTSGTTTSYSFNDITDTTKYRVKVQSGACETISNEITFTVYDTKLDGGAISNSTYIACVDGAAPQTIISERDAAGGSKNITYQWYRNGAPVFGATAPNYTPEESDFDAVATIAYRREAKDAGCGGTYATGIYTVKVVDKSDLLSTIGSVMVTATPTRVPFDTPPATITLQATNIANANYSWQRILPGVTPISGSSYAVTTAVDQQGTSVYQAAVSIIGCDLNESLTPGYAFVNTYAPLTGGSISGGSSVTCVGTPGIVVENDVAATGGADAYPTYQWFVNGVLAVPDGNADYVVDAKYYNTPGTYEITRVVTDGTGTVKPSTGIFTLQVMQAPALNEIKVAAATPAPVCYGGIVTLEVDQLTNGTYTWQSSKSGADWTTLSGSAHTFTSGTLSEGTEFRVRAELPYCNASDWTPNKLVAVYEQFNPGTIENTTFQACGDIAAPTIQATPAYGSDLSSTYEYAWYKVDGGGSSLVAFGSDKVTYSPGGNVASAAGTYNRVATVTTCSSGMSWSSGTYVIKSVDLSAITGIDVTPSNAGVNANGTVTLNATNIGGANYTWETSADGTNWIAATPVSTTYQYTTPPVASGATVYYRASATVTASSTCTGTMLSAGTGATVTAYESFDPGAIKSDTKYICADAVEIINIGEETAPTGGAVDYTYKWFVNSTEIAGQTEATLVNYSTAAISDVEGIYNFVRVVTSPGANVTETSDNVYTVIVKARTGVTISSGVNANDILCYGTNVRLAAVSVSGGVSHVWEQNDGAGWYPVSGTSTGYECYTGALERTTQYRVTVNNGGCEETSRPLTLNVYPQIDGGAIDNSVYEACITSSPQTIISERDANGGDNRFTYQWYRSANGGSASLVPGAVSAVYTPPTTDFATTGTIVYTREVKNARCNETISSAGSYTIRVVEPSALPSDITLTATPPKVVAGSTTNLQATNITGAVYEWYVDGSATPVPGVNTHNYTPTVPGPAPKGSTYTVKATVNNSCGINKTYDEKSVNVEVFGKLNGGSITNPGTVTICRGETATVYGNKATGGNPGTTLNDYTYTWMVKNIGSGSNATHRPTPTEPSYTIVNDYNHTVGSYEITRMVTDGSGATATSSGTFVLNVVKPATVSAVSSITATSCIGTGATLTANVIDPMPAMTYSWEKSVNGAPFAAIPGATATTYAFNLTETANYRFTASNGFCEPAVSNAISIVTYPAFSSGTITSTMVTMCQNSGNAATIATLPATGNATTYTWYVNDSPITGATSADYTPGSVAADDITAVGTYTYKRSVTDACGSSSYSPGTYVLKVIAQPGATLTMNPDKIVTGGTTNFTLASDMAGTYTWYRVVGSTESEVQSGLPAGASYGYSPDRKSLTVTGISIPGDYGYKVRVNTDGLTGCNAVETSPATLTVAGIPTVLPIVTSNTTVENGQPETLTATASGNKGNVTYVWQYSLDGSNNSWSNVVDGMPAGVSYTATSSSTVSGILQFSSSVTANQAGYYRAVGTDAVLAADYGYGTFTHATRARIDFIRAAEGGSVEVTGYGPSASICEGSTTSLAFQLSGYTGSITGWESSSDGTAWTPIPNTSPTYNTSLPAVGTWYYRALISGTPSTATATAATVTVTQKPVAGTIQTTHSSLITCANSGTMVTVTGSIGTIEWQWRVAGDETWQPLATGATCDVSSTLPVGGTYEVRVAATSSGCADAYSNQLTVTVLEPVDPFTISASPAGGSTLCAGEELVLSSDVAAGTLTWRQSESGASNWRSADGNAVGQKFRVNTVQTPGDYDYQLMYEDVCGVHYSANTITITYNDAPKGGALNATKAQLCLGESTTLTQTGSGLDATVAWQVLKPGATLWEDIENTATTLTVTPDEAGVWVYRVKVTGTYPGCTECCTESYSAEQVITVNQVPRVNALVPASETVCNGYQVAITPTGTAGAVFNWVKTTKRGGAPVTELGSGAIEETLVAAGVTADTVIYRITPVLGACTGTSVEKVYYLWPDLSIALDEETSELDLACYGSKEGAIVVNNPVSGKYELYKDGVNTGKTGTAWTGLSAGNYQIVVSSASCSATLDVEITEPSALLTVEPKVTNVLCNGETTGAIFIEIAGGTPGYKVSIDGGAFEDNRTSYTGLKAKTYHLTVVDSYGCRYDVDVPVTEPSKLDYQIIDITGVSASGSNDAAVTLQGIGGTAPYEFSGSGISNEYTGTNRLTGLGEGSNNVYVRDDNYCIVRVPVEIGAYVGPTSDDALNLSAKVSRALTCAEAADAEVTVTVKGGKPDYLYSSDNGVSWTSSNLITGLADGVHKIMVKDAANITATIDVTVSAPKPLVLTANLTQPADENGDNAEVQLIAAGGSGQYQYYSSLSGATWTANSLYSGLHEGTYSFVARDNASTACQSPQLIMNIQRASSSNPDSTGVTLMAAVTKQIHCTGNNDGEITFSATGGTAPYTFSVNGDVISGTTVMSGLAAGNYVVQAKDNDGKQSATITLTIVAGAGAPKITNINVREANCKNNAEITVIAEGTGLLYSLDGAQWSASNVINNVAAGEYQIFVKDRYSCQTSGSATVSPAVPLAFWVAGIQTPSAQGAADGSIGISASGGGALPYLFTLEPGGVSVSTNVPEHTFTNLKAGVYTLTGTDANQCTTIRHEVVLGDGPDQLSAFYRTEDLACAGAPSGKIEVTVVGGTGTYTYSLDGRFYDVSNSFTGLHAGIYTVYVKDNAEPAHTLAITNITIRGLESLTVEGLIVKGLSTATATDAEVQLKAGGGVAPYNYQFNGGEWTSLGLTTGVGAGSYNVSARDSKGCIATATLQVNAPIVNPEEPEGPVVTVPSITAMVSQHPTCYGAQNGIIVVSATGGETPYSFSVDQLNWYSGNKLNNIGAGTYTVYVKELSSGRVTAGPSVVVTAPAKLVLKVDATTPITAKGATDGSFVVSASGGTTPYRYSMDGGLNYQPHATFAELAAGQYNPIVKDDNGCEATTSVVLADDPGTKITFTATASEVSCNGASDASATVTVFAPTGTFQYGSDIDRAWKDSPVLTGLSGGWRMIYVRNVVNLSMIDSLRVFISEPSRLAAAVRIQQRPTLGQSNGVIGVHVVGGSGNYAYTLGTETVTPVISNLREGEYSINVRDAVTGCATTVGVRLSSVDVVASRIAMTLNKNVASATYTLHLTTQPSSNVVVNITAENGNLVTFSPASVTFTPSNWNVAQSVGVRAILDNVGAQVITSTTRIANTAVSNDAAYAGIVRHVLVTVINDGQDCSEFEIGLPVLALNNVPVGDAEELCSSVRHELSATKDGAVRYEFWKDGIMKLANITTNGVLLSQTGTYTAVAISNRGCMVTSSPVVVTWEEAPPMPEISGPKSSKPGINQTYVVKEPAEEVDYTWTMPYGYTPVTGAISNVTGESVEITMGEVSASLQLLAKNRGSDICPSVSTSYPVEILVGPDATLFPTVVNSGTPITITPKDMILSNIAVVNTVGVYFDISIESGSLPLSADEEIKVSFKGNVDGGHYFVILYGTKGEKVIKRIVKD